MEECFIIDGYGKKRQAIKVICDYCGIEFLKAKRFVKEEQKNFCCKEHSSYSRKVEKVEIECHMCGKKFKRKPKSLNSKSGLYFCSRKCKDYAQSFEGNIKEIQPLHYNNGENNYRDKALKHYGSKCEICGFDEYVEILEVHHIDGNRKNNKIENLIVLCPNHHAYITRNVFYLNEDRKLILI